MKKSLLLLLLALILTACGGGNSAEIPADETNDPIRFKIGNTTWQTILPPTWTLPSQLPEGTILVAQNQDQNFIIAQKPGFNSETGNRILANAEARFFDFELISQNLTQWKFKGKRAVNDPMRVFHQKIMPVPGTNSYLIGVCSYEYWLDRQEVCTAILNGWLKEPSTNN